MALENHPPQDQQLVQNNDDQACKQRPRGVQQLWTRWNMVKPSPSMTPEIYEKGQEVVTCTLWGIFPCWSTISNQMLPRRVRGILQQIDPLQSWHTETAEPNRTWSTTAKHNQPICLTFINHDQPLNQATNRYRQSPIRVLSLPSIQPDISTVSHLPSSPAPSSSVMASTMRPSMVKGEIFRLCRKSQESNSERVAKRKAHANPKPQKPQLRSKKKKHLPRYPECHARSTISQNVSKTAGLFCCNFPLVVLEFRLLRFRQIKAQTSIKIVALCRSQRLQRAPTQPSSPFP